MWVCIFVLEHLKKSIFYNRGVWFYEFSDLWDPWVQRHYGVDDAAIVFQSTTTSPRHASPSRMLCYTRLCILAGALWNVLLVVVDDVQWCKQWNKISILIPNSRRRKSWRNSENQQIHFNKTVYLYTKICINN